MKGEGKAEVAAETLAAFVFDMDVVGLARWLRGEKEH